MAGREQKHRILSRFRHDADAVVFHGDCLDFVETLPSGSCKLIVTSPPYNIGKKYENEMALEDYLSFQANVIGSCIEKLAPNGSMCWQVGNHVMGPQEIIPLDILLHPLFARQGLKLRNRIAWHFEHGLHCSRRFSGRYEVILWYTKGDDYTFNLDEVRVPQKYPGKKHFRGPRIGEYSCNPLGKNPGDFWVIPNVKHNHVEKTEHPCQFPIELAQRLVLALTDPEDIVFDPFAGVGSAMVAAVLVGRRGMGSEASTKYCQIARERLGAAFRGTLRFRQPGRPVYKPPIESSLTINPFVDPKNRSINGKNQKMLPFVVINGSKG